MVNSSEAKFLQKAMKSQEIGRDLLALVLHNTVQENYLRNQPEQLIAWILHCFLLSTSLTFPKINYCKSFNIYISKTI